MTHEELVYKEQALRECFKHKLEMLNVDGDNSLGTVKCIKTFGALWHYTHQLLMAEDKSESVSIQNNRSVTIAEKMDVQATGLKMLGR